MRSPDLFSLLHLLTGTTSDFQLLSSDVFSLKEQVKSVQGQVDTFRQNDISALQQQVDHLRSTISRIPLPSFSPSANESIYSREEPSPVPALRSRLASSGSADLQTSPHPRQFHGPTSSEYDFNLAKSSLRTMGIQRDHIDEDEEQRPTVPGHMFPSQLSPASVAADLMWNISQEDAIRLIHLYDEACSILYPVIDVRQVATHIDLIYNDIHSGRASSVSPGLVSEHQLYVVRLIIGIGLLLDNKEGNNLLACQIFQIVEPFVSLKALRAPNLDSVILPILTVRRI